MTHYDDFSDDYDDIDEDALIQEIMALEHGEDYEFEEDVILDDDEDFDTEYKTETKPSLSEVMDVLKRESVTKPNAVFIYGLSDLSRDEIMTFRPMWQELTPAQRRQVIQHLTEASETMFHLNYRAVGLEFLRDSDPRVRETAIELMWEDDSLELMDILVQIAQEDQNRDVRAAAASALGRFILMGEFDDLPQEETQRAVNAVTAIWNNTSEEIAVRRRALESVANTTDDFIPNAIREAYNSAYPEMRVSAVFAMGRSCDRQWTETVLEEIDSDDAAIRYEAVRAAGELTLMEAVPKLAQIVVEEDREIVEMVIWSLGEIGGRSAMRVLEALAEKAEMEEDAGLVEAIEEALGSASLASQIDEDFDFYDDSDDK